MPSKIKTPVSIEQNRESQRRSRARRRDLIESLSREVAEYKSQGVAASTAMQNAARAVSIENQRLRELLALRGVSQAEILQYLATPVHGASTAVAVASSKPKAAPLRPRKATTRTNTAPSSARSQSEAGTDDRPDSYQSSHNSPLSNASRTDLTNSLGADASAAPDETAPPTYARISSPPPATHSHDEEQSHSNQSAEQCYSQPWQDRHETGDQIAYARHSGTDNTMLPPVSDCFCPPDTLAAEDTEGLETSCDTAAEILIQLHRKPDREQARAALGCVGTRACSVKNTTIFKLMDEFS